MIPIIHYPEPASWALLLQRPTTAGRGIEPTVSKIIETVRTKGDETLKNYAETFSGQCLTSLTVSASEWEAADKIGAPLKAAIDLAMRNIRSFHTASAPRTTTIETMPGIQCSSQPVAIERVGLYIPGGTAPLYSTLMMLGIPANIAGCDEIVVCTPPGPDGTIAPPLLYIAKRLGIHQIYKTGGAQAIAAMAYGTESIPQVDKIFGPGNQYVTTAKIMLQARGIAIDMPAGPSEVAILADHSCVPAFVAADLLSQAEHGSDSQVILVSDQLSVLQQVQHELSKQLETLPRKKWIRASLTHSKAILVHDLDTGIHLLNQYAPEHLIIACRNEDMLAAKVRNAGSVFLGHYTPESAGDYASGTNHTLPTYGYAKAYSGLSVGSFMKIISFQKITPEGLHRIAPTITTLATAEGLDAHANAVQVRVAGLNLAPTQPETRTQSAFRFSDMLRDNIRSLQPYTSARTEYSGVASIFLDANENTLGGAAGSFFTRYPDPQQQRLKRKIGKMKQVDEDQIFLGNGSDEAIDLLIRAICVPGIDHVIVTAPSYGMYSVSAAINDVGIRQVLLTNEFQLDVAELLNLLDAHTKIIFLCTPNNPTGNLLETSRIETILQSFNGLVVIDEAYADFADIPSWINKLSDYPNMVVLQTYSKAWGMAGLRLGMAFAQPDIIRVLNQIKAPYNISANTQQIATAALEKLHDVTQWITAIRSERSRLAQVLATIPCIIHVYHSDANFLLVRTTDADDVYRYLLREGIVVRNRSNQPKCESCLRLTIGTPEENNQLIQALTRYSATMTRIAQPNANLKAT